MRSNRFIVLSVILHIAAIATIAIGPQRVLEFFRGTDGSSEKIEPQAAEPNTEVIAQEAPAPAATKPTPMPEVPKPVKRPIPVRTKPVTPAPSIAAETKAIKEEVSAKSEPAPAPAPVPVQATPVAEDAAKTEAGSQDVKKAEDPAPVGLANSEDLTEGGGELGKGGATKSDAVEFTELKQSKGNKLPIYPLSARRDKRQGQVSLVYRVTKEGRVTDIQVEQSSGHEDLDKAAMQAISNFRYEPGQEGWARHPVSFTLKGEATTSPSRLRTKVGAQD